MSQLANDSNTASTRDVAGWIILAWVVVWSAAYFHSAVLHRFPGLLGWVRAQL
ncbi:hypothetical protein [Paludisphaera borealis]|uniref:Uncharacterized protein n=1 Tax=Paludisphaera borealis TaxID=1387353 RepID=A0A1U7CVK4_9BACT|nr:hypothetical protein [Paludisphaera borealis]APW62919.1 hypothetical protein BSF38_04475 [Paludisphaera borealis]MDR3620181.1 hypothetical protein [Paludisphaera borealis]